MSPVMLIRRATVETRGLFKAKVVKSTLKSFDLGFLVLWSSILWLVLNQSEDKIKDQNPKTKFDNCQMKSDNGRVLILKSLRVSAEKPNQEATPISD